MRRMENKATRRDDEALYAQEEIPSFRPHRALLS